MQYEEEDSIGPMESGVLRPSQRITVFKRPYDQSLFPFLFGLELELVLIPYKDCSNWYEVVDRLSSALTSRNITNRIHDDDKAPAKYDMWLITADGTIVSNRQENQWGLELVAPITTHTTLPRLWGASFQTVWQGINEHFEILQSQSCGTHLHVSVPMGWSQGLMALKPVAKAAIYFEECIDALMPSERVINKYCDSNRYNPVLRDLEVWVIFTLIENALSVSELAGIMCSDGRGLTSRYFRWNFQQLTDREKVKQRLATIEFRQPPGCTNAEELNSWALFGLSFITGSIYIEGQGASIDPRKPANLPELHRLCQNGSFDEPSWSEPINRLFTGKQRDPIHEDWVRRTAYRDEPPGERLRGPHDRRETDEVKCARHLEAFTAFFDDHSEPADDDREVAENNSRTTKIDSQRSDDDSAGASDNSEPADEDEEVSENNSRTTEIDSQRRDNDSAGASDNSEPANDDREVSENNSRTTENNSQRSDDDSAGASDNSESARYNNMAPHNNSEPSNNDSEASENNGGVIDEDDDTSGDNDEAGDNNSGQINVDEDDEANDEKSGQIDIDEDDEASDDNSEQIDEDDEASDNNSEQIDEDDEASDNNSEQIDEDDEAYNSG